MFSLSTPLPVKVEVSFASAQMRVSRVATVSPFLTSHTCFLCYKLSFSNIDVWLTWLGNDSKVRTVPRLHESDQFGLLSSHLGMGSMTYRFCCSRHSPGASRWPLPSCAWSLQFILEGKFGLTTHICISSSLCSIVNMYRKDSYIVHSRCSDH